MPIPVGERSSHVRLELDGIGAELERMEKSMESLQGKLASVRLGGPNGEASNQVQESSMVPLAAELGRIRSRIGGFNQMIQTLCEEVEL